MLDVAPQVEEYFHLTIFGVKELDNRDLLITVSP
jgi:hypothetical protein